MSRDVAAKLLIAAGDNPQAHPDRVRVRRTVWRQPRAGIIGQDHSSPARTDPGNRQANHALWVIAMVRLRHDPATRTYSQRPEEEGLSHREIVRCIKRYLARHLCPVLLEDLTAFDIGVSAPSYLTTSPTANESLIGPQPADPGPYFVSIPEAAKAVGVSRAFAFQLLDRGELPSRQFGRRRIIPVAALERMVGEALYAPS